MVAPDAVIAVPDLAPGPHRVDMSAHEGAGSGRHPVRVRRGPASGGSRARVAAPGSVAGDDVDEGTAGPDRRAGVAEGRGRTHAARGSAGRILGRTEHRRGGPAATTPRPEPPR